MPMKEGSPRRVGILGGTFDPVHMGHIALAKAAFDACELDEVIFMVAANPAFKQDAQLADAEDRLKMCQIALEGMPGFWASDLEIRRPGITYTIDTLRELKDAYPEGTELVFIAGEDILDSLHQWKGAEELGELASFAIVSRPGSSHDDLPKLGNLPLTIEFVDADTPDISSTQIRSFLRSGKPTDGLLTDGVRAYIDESGLYSPE